MILTRSDLPAWVKPLVLVGDKFAVFFAARTHVAEFVFELWPASTNGGDEYDALRMTDCRIHALGKDVRRGDGFLPPSVLFAAGAEGLHRARKRPRKSPFWWVVRHCISLDGSEVEYLTRRRKWAGDAVDTTSVLRNAYPFKSRKDAAFQAKMWRRDARVVRVRARGER